VVAVAGCGRAREGVARAGRPRGVRPGTARSGGGTGRGEVVIGTAPSVGHRCPGRPATWWSATWWSASRVARPDGSL
ncbi:MAG: hypothetical protein AVDCRST_MAG49-1766, partial [uncultured Thermomicrobiales bacterium]